MKRGIKIALTATVAIAIVSTISFVSFSDKIFAQDLKTDRSLELVNELRTEKGLKALTWNDDLELAAEKKANDMFEKGYFDHTSPSGSKAWDFILTSGYSYRFAGENLAADFDSVDNAFDAWKQSPTHLSNLVSDKYSNYAIYEKEGTLNGENVKVYVQLFGSL